MELNELWELFSISGIGGRNTKESWRNKKESDTSISVSDDLTNLFDQASSAMEVGSFSYG